MIVPPPSNPIIADEPEAAVSGGPADFVEHGTMRGHQGSVLAVRFNRDGNYAISCGADRTVRLWNPHKCLHLKSYDGHGYEVLGADISPDNSSFVSCGGDRSVFLWDVTTGATVRKMRGHDSRVNDVCLSPEGTVAASASYDATVRLWDLRSKSSDPIQILSHSKDSVSSVRMHEHEIVTCGIDGAVRVFDIRRGEMRADQMGFPATSATLSNDGNCILVSTLDSRIRLVDKSTGDVLNTYMGHKNGVYKLQCVVGYDDAWIAIGSEDGRVLVWDLVDADSVHTLLGHTRPVGGLASHPSLPCILSGSHDGTLRLFRPR